MNWEIFTHKWLKRAERGQVCVDDGDRFISLWIAFNGWMRYRFSEELGDRYQIESVKKMRDFQEVFDKLNTGNTDFRDCLEDLKKLTVVDMRFKNNREDIDRYDGTYESLIEVIYQVRCNLFHGRKDIDEDKKDIELVSLAYRILLPLFKEYLSKEFIPGTDRPATID
ncbi:hypothetical protein HQ585_04810 [candidate division KSB1 bacterium]|nr:hypothetical protein [candidate division KSB1 bacterium]